MTSNKKLPAKSFYCIKNKNKYESNEYELYKSVNDKLYISAPCKLDNCEANHSTFISSDFIFKNFKNVIPKIKLNKNKNKKKDPKDSENDLNKDESEQMNIKKKPETKKTFVNKKSKKPIDHKYDNFIAVANNIKKMQ